MANNRFVFDGLNEFRAQLRKMPVHLTGEGEEIVDNRAELAKTEIVQTYPRRTGDLRSKVRVRVVASGQFGAARIVENTSPLAHIFERGTEARHYFTVNGVKKLTGRMPVGKVFIPAVIRHRRVMYQELKALLAREGLEVTGDA